MDLHLSLPDNDVAFLDQLAEELELDSRSSVLHLAVRQLQGEVDENGTTFLLEQAGDL